ncbi:hypothetical protein B4102_3651 [Heyndrickxia sporothermodurans]|uniref:Uncharacterized protein n=1 Tax=Heyndrickxia sporothermodurans TaxID=46224 RepID=A0A150KMT2_9BACI|nr:hypothetical protein B4102_3651 [Heyndrickxia sporothermodurans]
MGLTSMSSSPILTFYYEIECLVICIGMKFVFVEFPEFRKITPVN